MPYIYKKIKDKYCVYKKHGGKKKGCTRGTKTALKKYMSALHMNEKIKGADGKACWKGYRHAGTENGKDKCIEVNEIEQSSKPKKFNYKLAMESLTKFMQDEGMNIQPLPKIIIINDDEDNAEDFFGKTAHYNRDDNKITLYTLNRHPKDVMRSFSHEMVHHEQNCDGEIHDITTTNTNEDGELRDIEERAYEKGNMMFRSWTDSVKNKKGKSDYKIAENKIMYEEGEMCNSCAKELLEDIRDGVYNDTITEAEYRGRKVKLNKPMRGDVKKFKVYVKDPKTGNIKKVNFGHGGTSAKKAGQKTMRIRKNNPKARKSFRARHNCDNPGPKTKARYWSCRKW